MSLARPRVRTWRRSLRALVHTGRVRAALSAPLTEQIEPGPKAVTMIEDRSRLTVARRPRQGSLGDCWVLAPMLAIFETAPERLATLLEPAEGRRVRVRLPGSSLSVLIDRRLPVDRRGRFAYARQDGGPPGWAGALEKAIAVQVAGSYGFLQRGFGRFGLELLTGQRVRTHLRSPSTHQILAWQAQHRAIVASTHPFSHRVRTGGWPLAPQHVYAVVGADPSTGLVQLRNPVRPGEVMSVDAKVLRRGFLAVDVSAPLR